MPRHRALWLRYYAENDRPSDGRLIALRHGPLAGERGQPVAEPPLALSHPAWREAARTRNRPGCRHTPGGSADRTVVRLSSSGR
ncbi:hypothetical protein [Streptomyces scopuliridis]|uniref:hypothetical protein n=1 Tax=Streptomyces scopuliridis TaxID=452529 RepID=UPI00368A7C7C